METFTVTVIDNSDVIPPEINLTSQTSGAIAGNIVIMGSITDNKELKSYTVTRRKVDTGEEESSKDSSEIGDTTDTGETEEAVIIASGTNEILNSTIAEVETSGLENGVYQIEILAEDAAGLTCSLSLMFTVNRRTIDKTPPQAVIDDIVLNEDGTEICVIGSVTDETKMGMYKLVFYKTGNEEDGTILAAGLTEVNGEIIGTIPTRFLPNGDYTLQLLAWDSQGNSSGMEVEFEYEETTDNKTGEIVLTEIIREEDTTIPVISGELKAAITNDGLSLTLTGSVADENLKEYTVVTGMADSENNPVSPVTLKTGTETIENATIV